MASRRRSRDNPVSLFAFQDIITSVTAIMILLVLILTLEFISRARWAGVADGHRQVATDLSQSIRQAESRIAALQRELAEARRAASRAIAVSADDLEGRLEAAETTQRTIDAAIARAEEAAARAAEERREAENSLLTGEANAAETATLKAEAASSGVTAEAIEQANRAEKQRQRDVKARGAGPTHLVFNPAPDGGKTAFLVEVSGQGVTVLPARGGRPQELGWGFVGPSRAFRTWLAGLRANREYVVIMLRPSGMSRYDAMRSAIVESGLDVGTELVPEELAIVVEPDGDGR